MLGGSLPSLPPSPLSLFHLHLEHVNSKNFGLEIFLSFCAFYHLIPSLSSLPHTFVPFSPSFHSSPHFIVPAVAAAAVGIAMREIRTANEGYVHRGKIFQIDRGHILKKTGKKNTWNAPLAFALSMSCAVSMSTSRLFPSVISATCLERQVV